MLDHSGLCPKLDLAFMRSNSTDISIVHCKNVSTCFLRCYNTSHIIEHWDIRDEIEVNMGVKVNIWDLWDET